MLLKAKVAVLVATSVVALNLTAKCLIEVTKPVSTLSGTVIGPDGLPISGAEVTVVEPDGKTLFKLKTGKDGRFKVKKIKPNGQRVKIRANGFLDYNYQLGNSDDSIAWETIRLSPNSECNDIWGSVTEASQ